MTELLDPPVAGSRPAVDPRFRQRWAEARRAEGRRRLRALLLVVAAVAAGAGAVGALHSPLFRVKEVTVFGNAHTPRAAVVAAAGLASGRALMVDVGSTAARRAVDALPWVGTVSFARHWPWTVVVTVTERVPAALVALSGATDVVAGTGRVLEVLPGREQAPALPVVEDARSALAGRRVLPAPGTTDAELGELLNAAAAAPPALAKRDLEFAYLPSLGLLAYLGPAKTVVLLGDPSQMGLKLAVLEELANRVGLSGYAQVDLTVPERPALTPLPNSGNT
jgi:cell division protein FtsQ